MEELVESVSGKVSCFLSFPEKWPAKSAVILCHGYLSDKKSRTNAALSGSLNRLGIATIAFDMYGHGGSEGHLERLTVSKVVDNIIGVHEYLLKKGFRKVGLAGSSFSGAPSLVAASRLPLEVLSLKCPVFDAKKLWDERLGEEGIARWKKGGFISPFGKKWSFEVYEDASGYDMKAVASKVVCPTLVVHGNKDSTVPISQAEELLSSLRCEKKMAVIEGADHFFSEKRHFDAMIDAQVSWILPHMR
jgi:hypothetical protein